MTSKEALNKVKNCGVKEIRLAMEQIEKDLEVLEIMSKYFGWLNFNNMEDSEKDKIMNYFLKKGENNYDK